MHVSLDSALGRQRRLNSVGESVLQIAPNAAAAYSLRSLTGGDPTVVRVRRGSDNHEQDFTASEVSAGALTSFVNAPVIAPLDLQALEADGRTGDFLIAKAAYSLRSLGTRQATLAATGDTVARADGKFVAQVRRNVNGDVKSFTADEVTDGTLLSFVNESFTSSLPLDVAGSAAAAYGLRNLSSSYSGNVVEVRRSSDDTTRDFTAAEITDGTLLAFVNETLNLTSGISSKTFAKWFGTGTVDTSTNFGLTASNASNLFVRKNDGSWGTEFNIQIGDTVRFTYNASGLTNSALQLKTLNGADNAGSSGSLFTNGTGNTIERTATEIARTFAIMISGDSVSLDITKVEYVTASGHVKTWYDQSGNSNDAAQATAASQPKIVSAGAVVTGGIEFDGSGDKLSASYSATTSSVFSVSTPHVVGSKGLIGLGTSANKVAIFYRALNQFTQFAGETLTSSAGYSVDEQYLRFDLLAGASSEIAVNGSIVAQGSSGSNAHAGISIGDTFYNDSFDGSIAEVIIYSSDQSDKRRAIEESIATANGITLGSFNRDGFVKTWYDQSVTNEAGDTATGNHATQATAASQPKIVSAGSLLNELDFDGTDDFLDIGGTGTNPLGIGATDPLSIYTVQIASNNAILGDDSNRLLRFQPTSPQYYLSTNLINESYGSTVSSTEFSLFSTNFGGTGATSLVQIHANGVAASTSNAQQGTSGANTAASPIEFIGARGSGTRSLLFDKSVKEIIIYVSDQTDNRTALEANIGEVYSIDLPSGVDPGFDQVDGFVETWYDQSGNGRDVTQATAGSQPKIVNAGALVTDSSGNPALVGDGTDDNLINSTLTNQLDSSDFLVTAAYKDELAMGITGAVPRLYLTSSQMSYNTNGTITYSTQTGRKILSFQVVGDTQEVFANGSSIGTASQAQANIGQSLFGVMQGGSPVSSGPLMEVLVYNSNQSAKRAAIEANINGHYSIF